MADRGRSRGGSSLVELMVVVAIVGALAALLLPAAQRAREAARRAACADNLKRIALALHAYEAAHGALPPVMIHSGSCFGSNGGRGTVLNTTGFALVLQHLGEAPLHDAYNFSHASCAAAWNDYPSPPNVALVGTPLANTTAVGAAVGAYACPSDRAVPEVADFDAGGRGPFAHRGARRSNYLLCVGPYHDYYCTAWGGPEPAWQGAFYTDRSSTLADFRDGTGQTCLAGESVQRKLYDVFGPYWGAGSYSAVHGTVLNPDHYWAPYFLPNAPWDTGDGLASNPGRLPTWGVFSSKHPGGVNMAFADGSVRFLRDEIDPYVWFALQTVRGGEALDADAY